MEEWFCIPNFDKYEITKNGKIRNKKSSKLLKVYNKNYYPSISIRDNNGKIKTCKIHRLVALTFLNNPENKLTVNHKDHNTQNYNLNNLEWATHLEQNIHKRKHITKGRKVVMMDLNDNIINTFRSLKECSRILKCSRGYISLACKNNTIFNKHKWAFINQNENLKGEIWKEIFIEDFKFIVSNKGRIKNKFGKSFGNKLISGYKNIGISNGKKSKSCQVHRLVAQAFLCDGDYNLIKNKMVNHIDGIKDNNDVTNLEVCTALENNLHSVNVLNNNNRRKIIQYDIKDGIIIKEFNSITEAKFETEVCGISRVCGLDTKYLSSGGYGWCYKENYTTPKEMSKIYKNKRKKSVKQICIKTNIILNIYESFLEASRKTKIHREGIRMAAIGKYKTAGGFKWELFN